MGGGSLGGVREFCSQRRGGSARRGFDILAEGVTGPPSLSFDVDLVQALSERSLGPTLHVNYVGSTGQDPGRGHVGEPTGLWRPWGLSLLLADTDGCR